MAEGFDMQAFGQRLRAARKAKQLTQRALAQAAGLRAPHLLSYLETGGRVTLQAATIVGLCRALGVSADYLLGLTDEAPPARE